MGYKMFCCEQIHMERGRLYQETLHLVMANIKQLSNN